MNYGFVKVACATPEVTVANCNQNTIKIIEYINIASANNVKLLVLPELCITGCTCGDLFMQPALRISAEKSLTDILNHTQNLDILCILGMPVTCLNATYNCAVVINRGKILGIVPKSNIEYNEYRYFANGISLTNKFINLCSQSNIPFGTDIIFNCDNMPEFRLGIEVGTDLSCAISPSQKLALAGATVIANPSANNEIIARAEYRRNLIISQSAKLCCGYITANCGFGESTTDFVFSGHNIVAENGTILAESNRFENNIQYTDIDLQKIIFDRSKRTDFGNQNTEEYRYINFSLNTDTLKLDRKFEQTPFIPADITDRNKRSADIITMQATGLAVRLKHAHINSVVLGLSGGLDSTLALIVCVRAFDMLNIDRKNIYTATMPCFGTTKRTRSNAELLAVAYGVSFEEINIAKSVTQHFEDIHHDINNHNVTYENAQARERTQVLMDLSNKYNALVVGTGDLSELALGWATYNGDHMSMYAVNASIPKTLVRHLVAYEASISNTELSTVLLDILDTPVSPELLPPSNDGNISQKTEDLVGPYELHDFFIYYFLRCGYTPSKIYYIATQTFADKYDEQTIKKWLKIFIRRFFTQQFKRSCMPDGVKVGSVGLSPRGDLCLPSDADFTQWLNELD